MPRDPWQIWELTLADQSTAATSRRATTDAMRPLYLPGGRFVYAQRTPTGFQLNSASIDPSTAHSEPASGPRDVAPDLSQRQCNPYRRIWPTAAFCLNPAFRSAPASTPEMYLVYSDGSGVESYRCDHGVARWGGNNWLPATWSSRTAPRSRASLRRSRTKSASLAPRAEFAGAIAETESACVAGERADRRRKTITPSSSGSRATATLQPILAESANDLVEPVLVAPRTTPKRHPSALHPWDYANLLALDARLSRDGASEGRSRIRASRNRRMRMDMQSSLGTAPVEQDGSFFVKVPGDRPIRFALLDAQGRRSAPGARLVLGSRRRAAHLRRLPHRTRARVGKSRARRAAALHDARRSDRSPSGANSDELRREAAEMNRLIVASSRLQSSFAAPGRISAQT